MRYVTGLIIAFACSLALSGPAAARVLKFEITGVELPAFEGRTFGTVGTYDRIIARATMGVAPGDPHNSIIVDLDRAPRNAEALVTGTAEVEILRPTNAANGNRRLFYEVLNRGNKPGFPLFNDVPFSINDLVKSSDAGNGFMMNRGYTLVWSGWQGDVAPGGGRMTFSPPVVPDITGLAREDFVFDHDNNPASAALSYPAADLDPAKARISVREKENDVRSTPAGLEIKFESPTKVSIKRPEGFDAGTIYELIYTAKDPKVMGLGFAATRDIVSFLRYEKADAAGADNPLAGRIDKAIGFGLSQSGRFLQDYLYLGFNADEAGRTVFEGLMPHISGGKKTFTNYRFSQPGRSPYQHADMLYPGADFPFTYPVTTDALTGRTDGFLARCLAANNCPKIIKTDSEIEFYQQRASLVVTDTRGDAAEDAGQCPAVLPVEPAALHAGQREAGDGQAMRLPDQSAVCRPAAARAARCDGCLDHERHGAAGQPLPEPRRRHAGPSPRSTRSASLACRASPIPSASRSRSCWRPTGCRRPRARPIRCSCRRPMPTAAPSQACICRPWRRRPRRISAGTCARPAFPKASSATITAR